MSLPGLVGLSLGVIYALGAIETTSQFQGAGLQSADLFPLIPLNQILARGIALAIYPYGVLVMMLLLLLFGLHFVEPRQRSQVPMKVRRKVVALVIGAAIVWSFFNLGWVGWLMAPPLLAYLHFGGRWAQQRLGRIRGLVVTALSLVVLLGGALSVVAPDPLPSVVLTFRDGTSTTGALVASTGQTWYITYGDDVRAIPESRVRDAIVTSHKNEVDDRSPWDLITDDLT